MLAVLEIIPHEEIDSICSIMNIIIHVHHPCRVSTYGTAFLLPVFTVLFMQELHGVHGVQLFSLQSKGMGDSASRVLLENTFVLQTEKR